MHILETVLLIGFILLCFSLLQHLANQKLWPYTILLLAFGLIAKHLFSALHLPIHLELSSDVTYFFLLPILLFGSAIHLNFHQFRLQFKTISFLSTFGLLLSIVAIGGLLALILGWDLKTGLLFGSLISATDPIAVLALFKSLGGPRRLALLADGESMINDATAVVMFRILVAIVIGGEALSEKVLLHSVGEFSYVFFGSLLAGAVFGYLTSLALAKIENDLLVETTLTLGGALLVFTAMEHYFHLSGVISTVVAGLFVGNLGRSRISPSVAHFVHELWDYLGFLALSFVFFFATFHLDISFLANAFPEWLWVVLAVLLARAISIYVSFFITNRSRFFKDEPNVPMSWQHIMNCGGLKGVIPLVLVFSLPDSYAYKEVMFQFTFAALLFTLFINGSTIAWLLKKLKLNLPSKFEEVQAIYDKLFDLEAAVTRLKNGKPLGISKREIDKQLQAWLDQERELLSKINQIDKEQYHDSLAMQSLIIERSVYEKLLERQEISEAAFFELDTQLDVQADAIEYPEIKSRALDKNGKVKDAKLFRQRIFELRRLLLKHPILKRIYLLDEQRIFLDRFMMVRARFIGSKRVLRYLADLQIKTSNPVLVRELDKLIARYEKYLEKADLELGKLKKEVDLSTYKKEVLSHALVHQHSPWNY